MDEAGDEALREAIRNMHGVDATWVESTPVHETFNGATVAVTADEACTQLPARPSGKYGRTLARLYTLVGKTSGRAQAALERGEELVAMRAQVAKRPPAGRADPFSGADYL